jgi:hypothetical protein
VFFFAELFLEFFLDLVVSVGGEIFLEGTKALDRDRMLRVPAVLWLLFWGVIVGALSALLFSGRILHPGPVPGLSLVLLPVVLGASMEVWGAIRSKKRKTSHLASWYGGVSLGFGLAVGRLVGLRFMADVWSV